MNPVTTLRPHALAPTFEAFLVLDNTKARRIDVAASTLAEAAEQVASGCPHKSKFVVIESDPRAPAAKFTHWYAVRQASKPRYVTVDHVSRAVHDRYAEHLFTLAVTAFDPCEPWVWSPGADVVGRDAALVEGRS